MPVISRARVTQVAYNAGFRGDVLRVAVAIAAGESGFNTTARALTPREDSRGLWQINVRAHPWGRSINLYDPQTNANAAMRVYRQASNSFRPWSVYIHGTYRQYLVGPDTGVAGGTHPKATVAPPSITAVTTWDHSAHINNSALRFRQVGGKLLGERGRLSRLAR